MLTKTKKRTKKGKPAKVLRNGQSISIRFPKTLKVSCKIHLSECLDDRMTTLGWKSHYVLNCKAIVGYGPMYGGSTARYRSRNAARDGAIEMVLGVMDELLDKAENTPKRQRLTEARQCVARFMDRDAGEPEPRRSPMAIAKAGGVIRLDAPPSRSTAMVPVLPDLPAELPAPVTSMPLSAKEVKRLAACEQQIERNLQGFFEAGSALAAINEEKLYRATHPTFDSYCKERWNFGRGYAYRLMDGAEIARDIATSPIGDKVPPPLNEAQVRPLVKIDKADRAEVWQRAVKAAPLDKEGKPRITAEVVAFAAHRWVTPTDQLEREAEASASRPAARNGKPTAEDAGERGGKDSAGEPPRRGDAEGFDTAVEEVRARIRDVMFRWTSDRRRDAVLAMLRELLDEWSPAPGL